MVVGFDLSEIDRYEDLQDLYPGQRIKAPLIDAQLTKADCLAMIERAGIALPAMYLLGYANANCVGCCKGGLGYWNKIRRDFPERFEEIATIEYFIGPSAYILRNRRTTEKNDRIALRDLPPDAGRYEDEPEISCSFFCEMAERRFTGERR